MKQGESPAAVLYRQEVEQGARLGALLGKEFQSQFDLRARQGVATMLAVEDRVTPAPLAWERIAHMLADAFRLMRPSLLDWWNMTEFFATVASVCSRAALDFAALDAEGAAAFLAAVPPERMLPSEDVLLRAELLGIVGEFLDHLSPSPFALANSHIRSLPYEGGGFTAWLDKQGRHTAPYGVGALLRTG